MSDSTPGAAAPVSQEAIERLVRSEVERQFEKEGRVFKDSIALAVKMLGGALTVFVAIFTILGFKSWGDIEKITQAYVQGRAEALILEEDSKANLHDTLTNLLNRTIVNAYLSKRTTDDEAVGDVSGFEFEFEGEEAEGIDLPVSDWNRLRGWILEEDLPLQDFVDTLDVLDSQSGDRKKADAQVLAELLNPRTGPQWMRNQRDKVEAILTTFRHKDLGASAAEIVDFTAYSDELRSKAAGYVGDVGYVEGVDRLLRAYGTLPGGSAKRLALVASARLSPDHTEVMKAERHLMAQAPNSGDPSSEQIDTVAALVAALPESLSSVQDDFNEKPVNALAAELVQYAARNGINFRVGYPRRPGSTSARGIPTRVIVGRENEEHSESRAAYSVETFQELSPYWTALGILAGKADMDGLKLLLPRRRQFKDSDSFPILLATRIQAFPGARATIVEAASPMREVDLDSLKEAFVETVASQGKLEMRIYWFDATQLRSAELIRLRGKDFTFALEEDVRLQGKSIDVIKENTDATL
jgi:hypothetical protein